MERPVNTRIIVQIFLVCLLPVSGLLITSNLAMGNNKYNFTHVQINGRSYTLELARTGSQRRQGLMYRTSLADDFGMLFIYPESGFHRIWMKNTLLPLTVIWLDDNEVVIGIEKLQPCVTNPCPSYGVNKPARYVIELNGDNNELQMGDQVSGLRRFQ